ncbi:hypothetical protein BGZ46_004021, partial [Entomortierella lignicola]
WNEEAKNADPLYTPAQADMLNWLSDREPGYFLNRLLISVGNPIVKRRGPRNHAQDAFDVITEDEKAHWMYSRRTFQPQLASHERVLCSNEFDQNGWISIAVVQLLAYSLKELQSVRFGRLPSNKISCQITPTVDGTDYYLTKLSKKLFIRMARKEKGFWFGAGYLNSSQPSLTTQQERSISFIKSNLPPLRGVDANFKKYMEIRDDNHADLDRFYNGEHLVARHSWDSSRARDTEYQTIADQLLKIVERKKLQVLFHGDIMAGENIARIVQEKLAYQKRAKYLESMDVFEEGSYVSQGCQEVLQPLIMAPVSAASTSSSFNKIGFWSPNTASVDWCESNYQVSYYIAE